MELIIIVTIVWLGIAFFGYYFGKKQEKVAISIKETLDLLSCPVVTFVGPKNKKLNLLVDTGCSDSIIDKQIFLDLGCKLPEGVEGGTINTGGGAISSFCRVSFPIKYKEFEFKNTFTVTDIKEQFSNAFKDFTLHGVLGNDFLSEYGYIIDFEDLKIKYKKK